MKLSLCLKCKKELQKSAFSSADARRSYRTFSFYCADCLHIQDIVDIKLPCSTRGCGYSLLFSELNLADLADKLSALEVEILMERLNIFQYCPKCHGQGTIGGYYIPLLEKLETMEGLSPTS